MIIILGPPGSGKGTQAELLCKKFGFGFFGAGDALRQRQKVKDFTGKKIRDVMERGELIPNIIIAEIWMDALEEFKRKGKFNGLVTEGNPRRMLEAKIFDEALKWYEWQKNTKVIFINISREESFNRLTKRKECKECGRLIPWIGKFKKLKKCDKCGGTLIVRRDDKPKAIRKRLSEFRKHTIPVIRYYKKRGILSEINGEQSIEKVFKDILKTIK